MKNQIKLIILALSPLLISFNFIECGKVSEEQADYKDPCSTKKCKPSEVCVLEDEQHGLCVSKRLLQIPKISRRSITESNGLCGSSECRFGECEVLNQTIFVCHCYKGITGSKCNVLDKTQLPCSSNPCYGNTVCINLADKFACVCEDGEFLDF